MDPINIAIVGGGISGLTTYLQLRKHFGSSPSRKTPHLDITIFESHDLPAHDYDRSLASPAGAPSVGGGYGLAANGMKSLKRLDPAIYAQILRNSFPTPRFHMRTRQGWTLGAIGTVIEYPNGPESCCMVTREVVLEALYAKVPREVIEIRKVVEVVDGGEAAKVVFEGGEERSFDLVIGADGIWSRTRHAISGEKDGPEYRGLSTLGGFVETKYLQTAPATESLPYPQSQTIMTFGHNGFLGYSPCTSIDVEITADHLRGKASVARGGMAFWWARSAQKDPKAEPDVEKAKTDLAQRMASWEDPNVPRILEHSLKTAMIPTYVLPKQRAWAGKRVVLVGDAAHALPTSSGQGVSQSVEDAEALAMLLAHPYTSSNNREPRPVLELLTETFEQYMTVRKAHVERILDAGNRGGDASRDLNIVAEYTMYAFLWIMLRFFSRFLTKEIEEYDVVREVEEVVKRTE